ncbi:hypothetical protein CSB69_4328 [Morganella morganii]|nr:hypothetical protein CSB69_4328 [Morganella morganii]EMP51440.1 hypothetical protein C790_01155 [Morganella morganii SC01]
MTPGVRVSHYDDEPGPGICSSFKRLSKIQTSAIFYQHKCCVS